MTIFAYGRKKNAVGYGKDVGGRPRAIDESGGEEMGRGNTNPLGNRSGSGEDRRRANPKEADPLVFVQATDYLCRCGLLCKATRTEQAAGAMER